jgi:hypothetical protein
MDIGGKTGVLAVGTDITRAYRLALACGRPRIMTLPLLPAHRERLAIAADRDLLRFLLAVLRYRGHTAASGNSGEEESSEQCPSAAASIGQGSRELVEVRSVHRSP